MQTVALDTPMRQDGMPLLTAADSGNDVLDTRVSASEAVFLVNRVVGSRARLTLRQLNGNIDGRVGSGGDLSAVGLTIERSAEGVR